MTDDTQGGATSWIAVVAAFVPSMLLGCSAAGADDAPRRRPAPAVRPPATEAPGQQAAPTIAPQGAGAPAHNTAGGVGEPSPSLGTAGASQPYDPTVTFDWPEAVPGTGSCKAGRYSGTFDGIYSPGVTVAGAPIPLLGNIDMTLEETPNGEFFEVGDGMLVGVALGLFPFEARISGALDCTTGEFDAYLNEGVYIVGVLPYTFEGPLDARYDEANGTLANGEWEVGEPDWATHTYGGAGTWFASWTP